jgi:isoleucyl-tRNA synthetase
MYKEFKGLNLPAIDKEILEFWEKEKIFEKSYEQRDPQNSFVFYEGPPSANGMPGIHHVMARTIKDIFCRYQTLNGKRVERKGGWDTHGLPIELAVEKELGITKEDIGKKISVDDYNHKCRETVMRFKDSWDEVTVKSGYWVDLDNPYITYENSYIETVWFLLKRLYEKGYLYKGYTIQPYSPAAGTGLSSHELNMPGTYKDVTDTTVVAMFKVSRPQSPQKEEVSSAWLFDSEEEDVRILAWTTTPWTLPSNTALTVGANIDYVKIKTKNPYTLADVSVVCALPLVSKWFGGKNQPIIEHQSAPFKGEALNGITYEQLLDFGNEIQPINGKSAAFKVITDNFVTTEDGTGVVHTAPSFGADDRRAAAQNGIGDLTLVDKQGKFIDTVGEFSGRYVKNYTDDPNYVDVNVDIAVKLKLEGYAFNVQKYVHPYPHCWRTDKPILYYPLDSWFIAASKAKERMFELNKTINWKPAATGEGRFGKWLENLQDWNLSRSRYWGIGLPIWRNRDPEMPSEKMIGSLIELQTEIEKANSVLGLSQVMPKDLHRPYIDEIILVSDEGEKLYRELDLIDVWFDSGSMPYAQWGLDYEKLAKGDEKPFKTPFEISFPADFIAEGVDQTRGWFYTLHAIAVMAYDSVAFKNVVSNGLVQDKDGQKMSKSKGNAVEPFETIAKHGADATRWYMVSNAQPWDNLKFDIEGITEVRNKFFGTLYNTYNFFAMYANVDGFIQDEMNQTPLENRIELDRWVLSRLHSLVAEVSAFYADYEPTQAARAIEKFVDNDFSNWFVRLSRRRFWKGEMSLDKKAAYETMYECLMVVGQLTAPIAPFFSDWLYRNLTENIRAKAIENNTPLRHASVHLSDLTKSNNALINKELEQRMDYAQRISSLILSLRKKAKIRVRQPLQKAMLPILDANFIAQVEGVKDLILAETNVKVFEYITDTSGVVKKRVKPNFKTLGKTLGGNMKFAQTAIEALTQEDINQIEKDKTFSLNLNGENYALGIDDFLITSEDIPGWEVASDGDVTVALDITLNDELIAEGIARDLVNKIQTIRKEKNLSITDKISIKIEEDDLIKKALESFRSYIQSEVLAQDLFSTTFMKQRSSDYNLTMELEEDLRLSNSAQIEQIEITDDLSLDIKVEKVEEDSENRLFIKKLISQSESDRIEKTISTKNIDKFSEAICAFANDFPNHKQAGYLLIGVKDDGTLSGLEVTDELLKDIASIRNNGQILPQPAMIVEKYAFEDGDVAVVQVLPSLNPPVRYRGRVWIRVGSTKQIASEKEERRLTEKRTSTAKTFDALPCQGARIEDLNVRIFKDSYLPEAVASEILQENHREPILQLASLKMYDLLHNTPTNAGVLGLGLDSLDYMPGAYIQYVKFAGTSTDNIVNEKRFSGNLIELLRNLDDFIKNNVITQKPVFVSALREQSVFNYPYKAVRELLMNAIMHRNYESNAPIRFYEFSDRIEIQNSGALYGEANVSNFPRVSDYRNPVIAEVLKNLGYINRFNVGISNAKIQLKENGNLEPVFDLTLQTQFLVTIFST